MIALPATGLIMSVSGKFGVKWFGVPFLNGLDHAGVRDTFKEAHEVIGIVILVVIAVHVLGALKHKFVDKDDTMKRISL